MSAPVLLVADDLATIAAVRRLVGKEGYELILATSAADALIAFGHHLPGVVLLDPKVESDRGAVVLEELQSHPDGALARVLLLGETVPGFAWPVVPLPPDPASFIPMLEEATRGGPSVDNWKASAAPGAEASAEAPAAAVEPDPWRVTAPRPPGLVPIGGLDPNFGAVVEDGSSPDGQSLPHDGAPPLERAIAIAAAARLQAREAALAREATAVELGQTAQRLQEEKDLERAENQKAQLVVERLRAELADEKGRGGEARVAAERAHYLGVLREKDLAIEGLERDLEGARDEVMRVSHEGERKLDELKKMARAMEGEIERVKTERDAVRAEQGKGAELVTRLAAAEEATRLVNETLRAERENAQKALGRTVDDNSGLQRVVAQLESAVEEQKRLFEREVARRAEVEGTLATTLQHAEELENRTHELESRWQEASAETGRAGEDLGRASEENAGLKAQAAALADERDRLAAERDALVGERDALCAERDGLSTEADRLGAERDQMVFERDQLVALRDQLVSERDRVAAARDGLAGERDALAAEKGSLAAERDRVAAEATRLSQLNAELTENAARAEQQAARLASEQAALAGQTAALSADNAGLLAELAALKTQVEGQAQAVHAARTAATQEAEALRDQVRQLEARAIAAEGQAHALEEKLALPVRVAGRAALMVPRAASVDRPRLAELVCQLVLGRNEVKLELGTEAGLRTLWLSRGALVAAETTGAGESLIERARRDGLIDSRQESELRMLRLGTGKEVLDVLRQRGFLRQAEVSPLVQRFIEQVALDALSEASVGYRVTEESCGPEVLSLEVPRPLLPLLAEALRRGLAPEALLELLGGGEAIPVSRESSLDLRTLGFTEKERRLLGFVDGQATVEELSMVAGVKPEAAFRALLVGRYLGLIEVRPPTSHGGPVDPELDVKRLLAKFEEVQEADYFTILGLGRTAGTDEVQRSFERLSREFDPIRFSGHPDARLQQQAQVVFRLLEEAARALEDDRRRSEYARHLLD